jgi:hypothetical protein
MSGIEAVRWKNRNAIRISNGIVELVMLRGGGHVAAFSLLGRGESPLVNALWEAPWQTLEPDETPAEELSTLYGAEEAAKFLASYTGHSLCLDYFGAPSADMRRMGAGLHGEAGVLQWDWSDAEGDDNAYNRGSVSLPLANLVFEREIRLGRDESVAYVVETLTNRNDAKHSFDWVQHVTFGSPLLTRDVSSLIVSADRGMTAPHGYEGYAMLDSDRVFDWPLAPGVDGTSTVDLQQPFAQSGKGFIAGVRLDPQREVEFLLAINWQLKLGVAYLFRRRDFPWMTLWEENRARPDAPWNGITQARGMEFGTCPLPLGRDETARRGPLFDTPRQCVLSAGETKQVCYLAALFEIPEGVEAIAGADAVKDKIIIHDGHGSPVISIPASGSESHLALD